MKPVKVKCYSGRAYGERPISFTLEGVTHSIHSIDQEWREPGTRHFRVCTGGSEHVELCYNERNDEWSVSDQVERSWDEEGL